MRESDSRFLMGLCDRYPPSCSPESRCVRTHGHCVCLQVHLQEHGWQRLTAKRLEEAQAARAPQPAPPRMETILPAEWFKTPVGGRHYESLNGRGAGKPVSYDGEHCGCSTV